MAVVDDDLDDYVSAEECAARLGLPVERVVELVERRVLRAYRYAGWGELLVQPALIPGVTTSTTPRTRKPRSRP
ncbi:hypothetical protein BHQ19_18360 [Mycolicibacterium porcinum]|nr:hypothetical protein BHQ19_18360 [Mycolicibacterium porcinum]